MSGKNEIGYCALMNSKRGNLNVLNQCFIYITNSRCRELNNLEDSCTLHKVQILCQTAFVIYNSVQWRRIIGAIRAVTSLGHSGVESRLRQLVCSIAIRGNLASS